MWWNKFNYVTAAAMDSGTIISLLFIFFTLQLPKGGTISVNWWGNNVFMKSALCPVKHRRLLTCGSLAADWLGSALKSTPPDGIPMNF